MTLKTGPECSWHAIKVGEVFAYDGCWMVAIKTGKYSVINLATDWISVSGVTYGFEGAGIGEKDFRPMSYYKLYKLPLSIQRLWKEE